MVTSEGQPLVVGDGLKGKVITVAAGAELELRFAAGHRVQARGPALLLPTEANACSIISGHGTVAAGASPFYLGLSDGRLTLSAGAAAVLEVMNMRSHVGIIGGSAQYIDAAGSRTLQAGQALAGSGAPFTWIRETTWTPTVPPRLHTDPNAQRWVVSAVAVPLATDARLQLTDLSGIPRSGHADEQGSGDRRRWCWVLTD